ncbi:MAG: 5-(carboxyamino)imidazole ribonucleotide mutase, partial [Frankiaceae bacterium]|nr:5-(carboxyamino)imidazole ribonucleotide mutase [Frankiaceae bacterium]
MPDRVPANPESAPASVAAPIVGVIMGSDSDWSVMEAASAALREFDVPHECRVVSAHRTPLDMADYAASAAGRGLRVIIAAAGGAAHLPGMVASLTPLPVIGVPIPLSYLDGMDSLLSIVQMPAGVPVATVSVAGARNAGLLAVRILASGSAPRDAQLRGRVTAFQESLADAARAKGAALALPRHPHLDVISLLCRKTHVAGAQRHHAVMQVETTQHLLGASQHAFVLVLAAFGRGDRHQLDLGEL